MKLSSRYLIVLLWILGAAVLLLLVLLVALLQHDDGGNGTLDVTRVPQGSNRVIHIPPQLALPTFTPPHTFLRPPQTQVWLDLTATRTPSRYDLTYKVALDTAEAIISTDLDQTPAHIPTTSP